VKLAQAILETGYFNEKLSKSYYNRSNHTNMFGMGYNKRGYANTYFTTIYNGKTEKWAVYPSQWQGILDRYAWDKQNFKNNKPQDAKTVEAYIHACAVHGYWVESGRDAGYTKLLYNVMDRHKSSFDTLLAIPFFALASSILLIK
jgi:flagellum-specific peptidoglycan hydrolase FlgJ